MNKVTFDDIKKLFNLESIDFKGYASELKSNAEEENCKYVVQEDIINLIDNNYYFEKLHNDFLEYLETNEIDDDDLIGEFDTFLINNISNELVNLGLKKWYDSYHYSYTIESDEDDE